MPRSGAKQARHSDDRPDGETEAKAVPVNLDGDTSVSQPDKLTKAKNNEKHSITAFISLNDIEYDDAEMADAEPSVSLDEATRLSLIASTSTQSNRRRKATNPAFEDSTDEDETPDDDTLQPPTVNKRLTPVGGSVRNVPKASSNVPKASSNPSNSKPAGSRRTDDRWLLVVDGIDGRRFTQSTDMLREVSRIAPGARVLKDKWLQGGGWMFFMADQDSFDRIMGSRNWGVDAFGGRAQIHRPASKTEGEASKKAIKPAFSLEKRKLVTDDVPADAPWEDVVHFYTTELRAKRVVSWKGNRPGHRPVMLEFSTEHEVQVHLTNGYVPFFSKTCRVRQVKDFTPQIFLCRRCQQKHAHPWTACRAIVACPDCAGPHFRGDLKCPVEVAKQWAEVDKVNEAEAKQAVQAAKQCVHCKKPHSAGYGGCDYVKQLRADEVKARRDQLEKAEKLRQQVKQQSQQPPGPTPSAGQVPAKQSSQPPQLKKTPSQQAAPPTSQQPIGWSMMSRNQKRNFRSRERRRRAAAGAKVPSPTPGLTSTTEEANGDETRMESTSAAPTPMPATDKDTFSSLIAQASISVVLSFAKAYGIDDIKAAVGKVIAQLATMDIGAELQQSQALISQDKALSEVNRILNK